MDHGTKAIRIATWLLGIVGFGGAFLMGWGPALGLALR